MLNGIRLMCICIALPVRDVIRSSAITKSGSPYSQLSVVSYHTSMWGATAALAIPFQFAIQFDSFISSALRRLRYPRL